MANQGDTLRKTVGPPGAESAPAPQELPNAPDASTTLNKDDVDALMAAAAAVPSDALSPADPGAAIGQTAVPGSAQPTQQFDFPVFESTAATPVDTRRVSMLSDVNLKVRIELGRTRMLVEDVLKLGENSVVELDKLAGDPVDVYANDRLVARGEVLVLDDSFCVRISEVVSRDPHRIIR